MGRLDVLRSILHSAARHAGERVSELQLGEQLRSVVEQAIMQRVVVGEARLTAAVGRVDSIESATVSVTELGIAVQATDTRGGELSVTLQPATVSFAPRGAKEVTFRVEPQEAVADPRVADVFGAIATEIGQTLWAAVLPRTQGAHQVFVHRTGDLLSADLRTIPGVRQAGNNPMAVAMMDALQLREVRLGAQQLMLRAGLQGIG